MTVCKTACPRTWRATRSSGSLVDFLFAIGSRRSVSSAKSCRADVPRPPSVVSTDEHLPVGRDSGNFTFARNALSRTLIAVMRAVTPSFAVTKPSLCAKEVVLRTLISRVTAPVRSHVRVGWKEDERQERGRDRSPLGANRASSIKPSEFLARASGRASLFVVVVVFVQPSSLRLDRSADRSPKKVERWPREKREDSEFMSGAIPTTQLGTSGNDRRAFLSGVLRPSPVIRSADNSRASMRARRVFSARSFRERFPRRSGLAIPAARYRDSRFVR